MNIFKKKKEKKFLEKVKDFFHKKHFQRKKQIEYYSFKEVLIIMIFSIGIGIIMTVSIINLTTGGNYLKNSKELNKLLEVYNTINSKYYGEIDKDKLISSAISGMLASVQDPYTTYIDKDATDAFMQKVKGEYEGIGCEIGLTTSKEIIVINIFKNSPSEQAGLEVGDIILKVDDKDYQDKTHNDVSKYIKNSSNSKIKLTIKRKEEEKEITIQRKKIEMPSVTSELIEKNNKKIGYLKISIFSGVTYKQFKEKLDYLEKENIDSLIIDVRDNSGGYLDTVTDICDIFLSKNQVIYKLEDKEGTTAKYAKNKENRTYPIAVLVNENSASASEILASAIKESYNGYIVGTKTYGKGTVQQTLDISDGSMIKYTHQKWLTPNGNSIDGIGLEPTNYVELSESYIKNPTQDNDNQLQEAIKILTDK